MRIGLIVNPENGACYDAAARVIGLAAEYGAQVLCTPENSRLCRLGATALQSDRLFESCDVIITLGGDGTILHAAPQAAAHELPVLGINLGTIGYMAEVEAQETALLRRYFEGRYRVESRMLLDVRVLRGGEPVAGYTALNEAVISKGSISRIIELKIAFNGRDIFEYRADGVILATPTGSTAYSMSAGGPIIDPGCESIILTPICPYSLVARSVVFSPQSQLRVCLPSLKGKDAFLSVDGRANIELAEGDCVEVRRAEKPVKLIVLKDISFYEILNIKLVDGGSRGEAQKTREDS